jgi:heme/copper-type cytochrome/quinol oxidase subunit 2
MCAELTAGLHNNMRFAVSSVIQIQFVKKGAKCYEKKEQRGPL